MTLWNRLRAPLTSALAAGLVIGLVVLVPSTADAAAGRDRDKDRDRSSKAAALAAARADGLTASPVHFKKSSYLCYGYAACAAAGMGSGGYATANKKMYWRMYAGHNCTNYVAYRLVQSGMPNSRPWAGGGNATYWGTSVPSLTNGTPTVGAVAWWKANQGPAGSAGHVAYVERVVSADEIVISQDSWRGDFSWATVTRTSGNWPSGFIHFNDADLVNTAAPVVDGLPKVGAQLTATSGSWTPTDATVRYQWFANGAPIPKATKSTLPLTADRIGQTITVRTTARKLGYAKVAAVSTATAAILPGQFTATAPPTISGVVKVEKSLTLAEGTWDVTPEATTVQWYADGQPIAGATGHTLKLTPDLAGRVISAGVTAQRTGWDAATVSTAMTAPVTPGTIRVRTKPVLSGTAKPGKTLTVATGAYRPAGTTVAVQWLRDGQPIAGATAATYRVTKDDLGTRVSAQVSIAKAGYTTVGLSTAKSVRVRTTPRIRFDRTALRHGVKVVIEVRSPHLAQVEGTLLVRVDGGAVQKLTLRHGRARLVLRGLAQGEHTIKAVYAGSPVADRTGREGNVRIR
ncbi:CHAP domain-containing protein [Nocardioides sp. MAH-18]|uniref:CHAP domain-containing protein n=1 Tax=Nocardioides agri TaxID=2682843 RepID=A0A6L6Y2X0_9ACTN|nr:CHAP domain-containing protein [Nocardioides sp. CGMCC 1.13656]MBA2952773.1 CHAP domain-containing protein [Nocardioides sp. CGMCC 1.13656]MVQ51935.1 CHAP domain-containing protein [Nocardioides sp. MAH-18]